jgi:hypothetical protein
MLDPVVPRECRVRALRFMHGRAGDRQHPREMRRARCAIRFLREEAGEREDEMHGDAQAR